MRPHEEAQRREEDQRLIARVGFSPWTNLAHLLGTGTIIVALVAFGGDLYSTQRSLVEATNNNTADVKEIQHRVSDVEKTVSAQEARTEFNQQQIVRVEERTQSDRRLVIQRLERVDKKLDRLIESSAR